MNFDVVVALLGATAILVIVYWLGMTEGKRSAKPKTVEVPVEVGWITTHETIDKGKVASKTEQLSVDGKGVRIEFKDGKVILERWTFLR